MRRPKTVQIRLPFQQPIPEDQIPPREQRACQLLIRDLLIEILTAELSLQESEDERQDSAASS